jgi:hypothetical protein
MTKIKKQVNSDNLIRINFNADAYFLKQGLKSKFTEYCINDNYIYGASLIVDSQKSKTCFLISKFDIQLGLIVGVNEIDLITIVPASKDMVDRILASHTIYDFYLKDDHLIIDMLFVLPENIFNRYMLSIDVNTLQLVSVDRGRGNLAECNRAVLRFTRLKDNKLKIIDETKQTSFDIFKSITTEQIGKRFIWINTGGIQVFTSGYADKHYQYLYKKDPDNNNYCWEHNQISFISHRRPLFIVPAQLNHAGIGKAEIIYCDHDLGCMTLFRQHESIRGEVFYIEQTPDLTNEIKKMSDYYYSARCNIKYCCDHMENEFMLYGQHVLKHVGHRGELLIYSFDAITAANDVFHISHEDEDGTIYMYYVCKFDGGRSYYIGIPAFLKIRDLNIACYKTDFCYYVCDRIKTPYGLYHYPIPYANCDKYSKNLVCVIYDRSSDYHFTAISKEEVEKRVVEVQELKPVCFSWKYYGDIKMEKVQC